MDNIKVIGFDLDGTLYNYTPEIQKKMRGKIYEKLVSTLDLDIEKAEELFEEKYSLLHSGSRSVNQIAESYGKEVNGSNLVQEALQEADFLYLLDPNPKVYDMLIKLRNRKKLDLLTGSAGAFALKKLAKLGINWFVFDYILAGEDGSKSSGEMYEKWLNFYKKLSPKNFLYVGDNPKQDIEVPKKLGVQTCHLGNDSNADYNIKNILELERLI
jgi:FMN phosphatase YigB (HAD superfamily)